MTARIILLNKHVWVQHFWTHRK